MIFSCTLYLKQQQKSLHDSKVRADCGFRTMLSLTQRKCTCDSVFDVLHFVSVSSRHIQGSNQIGILRAMSCPQSTVSARERPRAISRPAECLLKKLACQSPRFQPRSVMNVGGWFRSTLVNQDCLKRLVVSTLRTR